MCLEIDGKDAGCGSALVDTGINQMYLRTDEGFMTPNHTIRNPNRSSNIKWVKRVQNGTNIAYNFPPFGDFAPPGYSFNVGEDRVGSPAYVVPERQGAPAFVNTGRNLLFAYSAAFDAVAGRFGLRHT
jgi:hypothetical protein